MELTQILRRLITTEKSVKLQSENRYTFEVPRHIGKIQIWHAFEQLFGVDVIKVNTMIMPGKPKSIRRRGKAPRPVKPRQWKKAIITVKAGQTVDILKP
jgi:large subunit ribosomal protein L23